MAITNIEYLQSVAVNPDTTANWGDAITAFPTNTLDQAVTVTS